MLLTAKYLGKDSVKVDEIAAGAVGTEELIDGAVTTAAVLATIKWIAIE